MTRFFFTLAFLCAATAALAQDRGTILVLDGSGSMWAQLPEGRSRIEVARDVLDDFLSARDPALPLGVISYGHNRRGDCTDIETIAPVGPQDARALGQRLRGLVPRGKTPLADALRRAAAEIPRTAEEADIVLITDGLETCGGDPCAVAAELAAQGIPIRAHVVGFGLTEGEVKQIGCVAEQTGGMVLATQSGAELSDALLRTASAPVAEPVQPGTASINLSIRADIAGRPDRVAFRAVSEATGETLELGLLDFATAGALPVELTAGNWLITADAGDQGNGEIVENIDAGDNRTIYVPFRGLLPGLDMPAPTGAFRAGVDGVIPYRITEEGLATGGGDFVFSLLPLDATDTTDRRIDYATQESRLGAHVGTFRTPAEPGDYLLVFHRNAQLPIDEVMERFVITVEPRPEVRLIAPPAVEPGARVPVSIAGGMGNSDRIEIWRDGAMVSWDRSIYVQDFFDNRYGPAKPLLAPTEPGEYELVYVFSGLDGPDAVAARVPLTVGEVPELDAAVSTATPAAIQKADAAAQATDQVNEDVAFTCAADEPFPCFFDDPATGLVFALPPGWATDMPTREAATAGGRPGPVRVTFFSTSDPVETIVLNPHQWTTMNGPCIEMQPGDLCQFASDSPEMARAIEILSRAIRDMGPPAGAVEASPTATGDGYGEDRMAARAWSDYPYRCLPDDHTNPICEMKDEETGLTFFLPENWVGEVHVAANGVRADFFEVTGDARSAHLNPETWPTPDSGCFSTRAGTLCTDMAMMDDTLSEAIKLLRRYMTTGKVLRTCGRDPCGYLLPWRGFMGTLPAFWGVEFPQENARGTLTGWFYSNFGSDPVKIIGLNQPGGEDCVEAFEGAELCAFTPYISTEELQVIRSTLRIAPPPPPGTIGASAGKVDYQDIDRVLSIIKGN
ncbi:Mg-chelatase subunit ChlD [Roseovarius mucosus DSM 17069]|uniref:Mg-chelatase subunit ChlD n=1 Tax=Roseovarius mucosus DSM 17069 TaxID=1288298 RepID=A0A0A0HKL8_9RHOB|nr:VWA domain-containing protein [Roseovarius mucosus]KGM87431.1 Mg-chelatase subunit ChlD [Roseovarius mucosus DSM 17069]